MHSFHFYRLNRVEVISLSCTLSTRNLTKFSAMSDAGLHHSVTGSQLQSTVESHDTRPHRMQGVNNLCTDIRVLRAEYCIVGILHKTAI